MGLLDVINGMQNGPRGQPASKGSEGMSITTKAILALLAYKAVKHLGADQPEVTRQGVLRQHQLVCPATQRLLALPAAGSAICSRAALVACLRAGRREAFSAAASAISTSSFSRTGKPRLSIRG